jgi:hypothetical protein
VIAALRRYGVRSIGIPVQPVNGSTSLPTLKKLATGSGAVAPAGGTDCNADGQSEIPQGDPLVCVIGSEVATPVFVAGPTVQVDTKGLAAAIVSLSSGFTDRQPITVALQSGASHARLLEGRRTVVDLHADNEIPVLLEVTCPVPGPSAIRLSAATPSRRLVTADVNVQCNPQLDAPGVGPIPGIAGPANGVDAAQVPAPQVNPQVNPNANPQPNANPNTAPNVSGNVGMAEQSEQQSQLAFAHDEMTPGSELAMSAGAFVGSAAFLLCVASAVAVRSRRSLAFEG